MPKLSTAAWIAHDLGLAASIGGALFGRIALDPSLKRISDPDERDEVNQDAWSRYGAVTLASHAAIAAPWVVGRVLRSGSEVSSTARSLTRVKDVLLGVSLASVAASAILGRVMGRRKKTTGVGPEEARAHGGPSEDGRGQVAIDRALDAVGLINLAANIGMAGVTAALAMEGSQSVRFALNSRKLP
jgi:hypothetical protein